MRAHNRLGLFIAILAIAACGPAPSQKAPEAKEPTAASPAADTAAPLGRLGTAVLPTHYALSLSIHPDLPRYSGTVRIDVTLDAPHATIYRPDCWVIESPANLCDFTGSIGE